MNEFREKDMAKVGLLWAQAQAEIVDLQHEKDALWQALWKYAEHRPSCAFREFYKCDCGLEEALAGWDE